MLSKIMAIDQNNYPEMLGHTCIINAPSFFKMIWQAVKSFIDPKTQEKIEVPSHDHNPLEALANLLPGAVDRVLEVAADIS